MKKEKQKLECEIPVSESEIEKALARIHGIVRDGGFGKAYTIAPRAKNRRLRSDYKINDEGIENILLNLQAADFIKMESSDNPKHLDDIVYIFKKKASLMPRWQEGAKRQQVMLYIKITWTINEKMFIISFHEDNI